MITKEEIELIVKGTFKDKFISIQQINKSTVRIKLTEGFVDIFQSLRDSSKFAFHAKLKSGVIYRLDCRPERKYKRLASFPWHLHKGKEEKVVASPFSKRKKVALREFIKFINNEIKQE